MMVRRAALISPHFQPALEWGGPIKSTWNMARGLAEIGIEVTVVTTSAAPDGMMAVPERREEEGVEILASPPAGDGRLRAANRYGLAPQAMVHEYRAIRAADIVHIEGIWGAMQPAAAGLSRALGKKYVICARGNLEEYSLQQSSRAKELFLSLIGREMVKNASALHFTSINERRNSPEWIRAHKSYIVPNSIEQEIAGEPGRFRRDHGLGSRRVWGIFGRVHPKKGYDVIIPAIASIDGAHRETATLILAGPDEGGYLGEVLELASRHGVERMIKYVGMLRGKELADAYRDIDALLMPSHEENFGNVVFEALAQGTKVILSEHVGAAQYVDSEAIGRIVTNTPEEWTRALERALVEEGTGEAAEASRRSLAKRFERSSVAEMLLKQWNAL